MGLASYLRSKLIPAELDEQVNRIRKPIGTLGYDPWGGYNNEAVKYGFSVARQIYEKYFRVSASGVDNVPAEGPVLIIANHSGQLPIDGLLIGYALASREKKSSNSPPRHDRALLSDGAVAWQSPERNRRRARRPGQLREDARQQ